MALKAIFDKAPLTVLTCQPLHAGQARVALESLKQLYAQVKGMKEPVMLEGVFRLACLVGDKAEQQAVAAAIREAMAQQKADGSFSMTLEETVAVLRAVWALYESAQEKAELGCLLRWFAWAAKKWDELLADAYVSAFPADLLELLEHLYRVTGAPGFLKLCRSLSASTMNWSSVLTTGNFQTTLARQVSAQELRDGLEAESGDIHGYYTRLSLVNNGMALADGVRASMARGWLSGSATELNAAKIGWEKLSRHHGAICGGLTDFPALSGTNPSAAVSTEGVGAWAEALVSAGQGEHAVWAWEALERLVFNAMPGCMTQTGVMAFQRVNTLATEEKPASALALSRLCRGYAQAAQAAVTAWPDGFAVNLMLPGRYAVCDSHIVLSLERREDGCVMKLNMKADQKAHFHMRIPQWARTCEFLLNGAPLAENARRLVDGCIGVERVWQDGDEITVRMDAAVVAHPAHHQGVYLTRGEQVMALPAGEKWALALCGTAREKDRQVVALLAPIAWKQGNQVPLDVPVRPAITAEAQLLPLTPYAKTPARIALFPQAEQQGAQE